MPVTTAAILQLQTTGYWKNTMSILIRLLTWKRHCRGETAIAGKDTEYNAPNTALVGETLTLTADSTDGKGNRFQNWRSFLL